MSTKKRPTTKQITKVDEVEGEDNKTPQLLDDVGTETLIALLISDTKTAAAISLNIDRKTLYLRIEKYGLNRYTNKIPEHALASLQMGSVKAIENYVSKIDHRDAGISIEASNQILNRLGITGASQQTNVQVNILNQLKKDKESYEL